MFVNCFFLFTKNFHDWADGARGLGQHMPEAEQNVRLTEAFEAAGFQDIHFLWEGTDLKTGEGNGVFRRKKKGEPDDAWIAYIVAEK